MLASFLIIILNKVHQQLYSFTKRFSNFNVINSSTGNIFFKVAISTFKSGSLMIFTSQDRLYGSFCVLCQSALRLDGKMKEDFHGRKWFERVTVTAIESGYGG